MKETISSPSTDSAERATQPALGASMPIGPSASYRADVWRLGHLAVKVFPTRVARWFGRWGAVFYFARRPQRNEIVVQNLLPAFEGNRAAAERAAQSLFRNFGHKLVDLWQYEMGKPATLTEWIGWEHVAAAQNQSKGMLVVTAHLGNWEFGAPALINRGIKLLVLTQAEPKHLTELRQRLRERWGIETLVVGEDAFAFVEIIKRLQAGVSVALLVDRPPKPTAVNVELFGRPFRASIAAAELARASGCAVLPAYVVATQTGYSATALPAIQYDRRELGNREARRQMTQQILSALEPAIRQHIDQWYHFVPVWGDAGQI